MDVYEDGIMVTRKPVRRNYAKEYDSDSSVSVVSVRSRDSGMQSRFGTVEPPDVLYSVDYVDESRRVYGSMYTAPANS